MQNQSLVIHAPPSLEEIIGKNCNNSGLISFVYNWRASGSNKSSIPKLGAWRVDLKEDISKEDWNKVCEDARAQTANTDVKLL